MTAFIDFGVLLLIMGGWFVLAFGVALILGAFIAGPMKDYRDEPAPDIDYDRAYYTLDDFRLERERKAARGRAAAQRARERRVG